MLSVERKEDNALFNLNLPIKDSLHNSDLLILQGSPKWHVVFKVIFISFFTTNSLDENDFGTFKLPGVSQKL